MRRPGDRARVWKQGCEIGGATWFFIACLLLIFSDGYPGMYVLSGIFYLMSFLDFRDSQRGWRIHDEPSPKCY